MNKNKWLLYVVLCSPKPGMMFVIAETDRHFRKERWSYED
jgi:hypothetical protein